MTLAFAKVDLEYKPQNADGSLDAGFISSIDIKANKRARSAFDRRRAEDRPGAHGAVRIVDA